VRVVDATLSTAQLQLAGEPARSLVVGSAPDTADVSAYVVAYDYEEVHDNGSGLTVRLDNSGGTFNSLTGGLASVTPGAAVELKRGVRVEGTSYLAELPRVWVESIGYEYLGGVSYCVLECIDWRGKLARWRAASEQTWSSTSATTILEWLLTQVGLTRASGAMTALTLDYAVRLRESGEAALDRLVGKMPEYLYAGLDGEVKWREIDGGDASVYTFGWNASHAVLLVEAAASAWQVNSVSVLGRAGKSGLAEDATQIAAVGTRRWTIYDDDLDSDAGCAQRAQAELDLYQAEATEATVVCRPCHGLELFDVVTVASPPWGGSDVVGRVIRFREEWNMNGRWHQVIGLGRVKDKDPGNQPAKKSARKGRQSRRRIWRCPVLRREPLDPWLVPVGGIAAWADRAPARRRKTGGAGRPTKHRLFYAVAAPGRSLTHHLPQE